MLAFLFVILNLVFGGHDFSADTIGTRISAD